MREYICRSHGKEISKSIIYDNEEEYYKSHRSLLKRWGDLTIATGDWVIADDGFIVQCLSAKQYQSKRHILFYFKFPMGTFIVTRYRDKLYVSSFYAQFTKPNKARIGLVDTSKMRKVKFATLVFAGIPIERAYTQTFTFGMKTARYAFKKGLELMQDDVVKLELKNQIEGFVSKLKDKFTEERLIDELEELLSKSRKGSMAHRQNLELILQLTGYMDNPLSKKKNIEEAEYKEIPPSQLPS